MKPGTLVRYREPTFRSAPEEVFTVLECHCPSCEEGSSVLTDKPSDHGDESCSHLTVCWLEAVEVLPPEEVVKKREVAQMIKEWCLLKLGDFRLTPQELEQPKRWLGLVEETLAIIDGPTPNIFPVHTR